MIEGFAPVRGAELYYREVGQGRPIIVLHGGPDFDHTYLLPELRQFGKPTLVFMGIMILSRCPVPPGLRRRYQGAAGNAAGGWAFYVY
jgi:hypothetical protein